MLVRSRRRRWRDFLRKVWWLERKRLLREAFWDRQRAELVAVDDYPLYGISKGEVLFDQKGYVNPSLMRDFQSAAKTLHA